MQYTQIFRFVKINQRFCFTQGKHYCRSYKCSFVHRVLAGCYGGISSASSSNCHVIILFLLSFFLVLFTRTNINIYCICIFVRVCVYNKCTHILVFLMKNINFIDHIAIILMPLIRRHTHTHTNQRCKKMNGKESVDNFIIQCEWVMWGNHRHFIIIEARI